VYPFIILIISIVGLSMLKDGVLSIKNKKLKIGPDRFGRSLSTKGIHAIKLGLASSFLGIVLQAPGFLFLLGIRKYELMLPHIKALSILFIIGIIPYIYLQRQVPKSHKNFQ